MIDTGLFKLASEHKTWLATRQAVIAGNIANANTPGYKSRDIAAFQASMGSVALAQTTTAPGHMTADVGSRALGVDTDDAKEVLHSGNSVDIVEQLQKSGDVRGAFALNSSVVKAFHRMLMLTVKG